MLNVGNAILIKIVAENIGDNVGEAYQWIVRILEGFYFLPRPCTIDSLFFFSCLLQHTQPWKQ